MINFVFILPLPYLIYALLKFVLTTQVCYSSSAAGPDYDLGGKEGSKALFHLIELSPSQQ
jgi:hypothetical protein